MALLTSMFREVAITGRTDNINAWFADRQGARWTERTVRAAFPATAPHGPASPAPTARRNPAESLRELTELHERGVVTDAEFDRLRADLRL